MMFPPGARSRLLPMSLPFRYFGAAVVFQLAAWAVLFAYAGDFISFEGGLGPAFAALHLVTLGVLAMTAIGATLQLLPVATRQPVRSLGAAKLAWWLLVPGIALFAAGAAAFAPQAMGIGATLVALALAIYAVLLAINLLGARGMKVVVAHGWGALACLLALAATGLALVARYEHGVALDHGAWRAAHLVLATYGFMGLLAFGLSNFLLPMLAVAPAPPAQIAYAVLALAVAAIAAAVLGWTVPAALLGLAAAAMHTASLERSLRSRLRPALGAGFLLVRVSWACLVASIGVALLMALDIAPARTALIFGLLLVPGWLLTFLLGVLQRIVPFLASVHYSSSARGTPLISALTPAPLLAAHQVLHLAALAALLAAALTGEAWLARAGAAAGLVAAVAFASFFAFVIVKVRHHGIQPPHQPAPA
jgi:hypothetical protein